MRLRKPIAARGRCTAKLSVSGGILAPVPDLHVGERSMGRAIRLARQRLRVAEPETTAFPARRSASSMPPAARHRCGRPAAARGAAGDGRRRRHRRSGCARVGARHGRRAASIAGRVGPTTRFTAASWARPPARRGGSGMDAHPAAKRCALPTTAFLDTPMRRPISAVEWPSAQSALSRLMTSSVQSMACASPDLNRKIR